MNKSESINELATALAKAQRDIRGAVEDSSNPHFKSKYASLQSVIDAAREPLTSNGLSIIQALTDAAPGTVSIETIMLHSSGQWISSTFSVPVTKMDAQGYGSATTYARRYSYMAMAGLAPIDDDANAAVASPAPVRQEEAKKIPAAMLKVIESATSQDELKTWCDGLDNSWKTNAQFKAVFKKKWDALKVKEVAA